MDLIALEKELENINQRTNKLLDLVRTIQKGEVCGEVLSSTLLGKLEVRAKTLYAEFRQAVTALTTEINK